jgi:hypothetical protein
LPAFPTPFNIILDFLARAVRWEEEIKGKEEVKLSLFADDIILYLRDPPKKNSTKKLLEIINSFGKVGGLKIIIQKSVLFCTPTMHRLRVKSGKQSHLQ